MKRLFVVISLSSLLLTGCGEDLGVFDSLDETKEAAGNNMGIKLPKDRSSDLKDHIDNKINSALDEHKDVLPKGEFGKGMSKDTPLQGIN